MLVQMHISTICQQSLHIKAKAKTALHTPRMATIKKTAHGAGVGKEVEQLALLCTHNWENQKVKQGAESFAGFSSFVLSLFREQLHLVNKVDFVDLV